MQKTLTRYINNLLFKQCPLMFSCNERVKGSAVAESLQREDHIRTVVMILCPRSAFISSTRRADQGLIMVGKVIFVLYDSMLCSSEL